MPNPFPSVRVEMLDGGHPLIRFGYAFATRRFGNHTQIAGQINVTLETMEEAKTLRDSLSAFIRFHEQVEAA